MLFAPTLTTALRAREAELRLAVRIAVAALASYGLAMAFGLSQGYWAVITAIIVMQASLGASLKAAGDRMLGTLAGAAYGGLLAFVVPHEPGWPLALAIVVAVAPMALLSAIKASFRVAPVTALIVLVPLGAHPGNPLFYAMERVFEIALGNIVSVAVALTVLPARAHGSVARSAARIAELNAELLGQLIDGLKSPAGRPNVAPLHASIRAALKSLEAAAEEAARERRGHLSDRADPEPLVRTLYRVRHDLVMIGRATIKPLPEPVAEELSPCLFALRDAAAAMLGGVAALLRSGIGPAPAYDAFDVALKAYVAEMDRQRGEGRTRTLPSEDVGRIYALRFGFEQLGLDLRDLSARAAEVMGLAAVPAPPEA